MMTIRKAISEMRKADAFTVYCNNGTKIYLRELNTADKDLLGKRKIVDGEYVMKILYITLEECFQTRNMESIHEYKFSKFREDEYLIPEKVMNQFIDANGGINERKTIPKSAFAKMLERDNAFFLAS